MHVNESKECMVYRACLKAYRKYVLADRAHLMGSKTLLI